jgi:homocysteine S-methyltransferase
MTQPVYDPLLLESFLDELGDPQLPILVGILPLYSYRNAEFLHNEVPGMRIPEAVRERMRAADGKRAARAEGVAIAREALEGVRGLRGVRGVYVMPPFGRYEIALEVLGL